jgi:hypothetical protein
MKTYFLRLTCCLVVAAALGCSGDSGTKPPPETNVGTPSAEGEKYLLKQEPASPQSVGDVRAKSEDGEAVVVVGRIGGSDRPFTGRASFTIVDLEIQPCQECEHPWCDMRKRCSP